MARRARGIVLAGLAACASGAQGDEVLLRAGRTAPEGEVRTFGLAGVVFEDPFGVERIVRWDHVLTVGDTFAAEAEPYMRLADLAWRGRTRLERGDAISAEPMFEALFEAYAGIQGEMASMVAEGLLRCRLRRSAHTAAIEPWLAYLNSENAGPYRSLIAGALRPAVDASTGLVPSLAPVWLKTPAVEALAESALPIAWDREGAAPPRRAQVLGELYRHAARFEAGLVDHAPDEDVIGRDAREAGVRLVHMIVKARTGDEGERAEARQELAELLAVETGAGSTPRPWIEAWIRLGLGRSLLREADRESRLRGIVELLHVPARFGEGHPYLAGIALAEAAVALDAIGEHAGAQSLIADIRERFSTHAAIEYEPLRALMTGPISTARLRPGNTP